VIENPESSPEDGPGEQMRPPGEEDKREEAGGAEADGQSDDSPMKRIDEDVSGDEETEDFDDVESGDL
jgi:hypothetical protein